MRGDYTVLSIPRGRDVCKLTRQTGASRARSLLVVTSERDSYRFVQIKAIYLGADVRGQARCFQHSWCRRGRQLNGVKVKLSDLYLFLYNS